MGEAGITFSLRYQARALIAHPAEKVNSVWIVGTNSLREENEVRFLQYDADQERLLSVKILAHNAEIWDISPSATEGDLFFTVWSKVGTYGVSLWQALPMDTMSLVTDLQGHQGVIRSVKWHPLQPDLAITIEEGFLRTWSITSGGVQASGQADAGELVQLWGGALHPRQKDVMATAGGNNVQLWDLRTMSRTGEVSGAHRMPVRDVSFASHNEHRFVTGGDDCRLRFWDMRMLGKAEALLELGGHSHWLWRAQYSPFHDPLVASSSSDSLVNLYHTPQLAAHTAATPIPDTAPAAQPGHAAAPIRAGDLDGKAHTFDEHEDSVYGLAWSAADPWLFASLSYDGRVVVNKVPKNVKYKVLI